MDTFDENRFYELLSALQKSIRRCEVNAARYFAQQLMGTLPPVNKLCSYCFIRL